MTWSRPMSWARRNARGGRRKARRRPAGICSRPTGSAIGGELGYVAVDAGERDGIETEPAARLRLLRSWNLTACAGRNQVYSGGRPNLAKRSGLGNPVMVAMPSAAVVNTMIPYPWQRSVWPGR